VHCWDSTVYVAGQDTDKFELTAWQARAACPIKREAESTDSASVIAEMGLSPLEGDSRSGGEGELNPIGAGRS
jgi:hypothetical protein